MPYYAEEHHSATVQACSCVGIIKGFIPRDRPAHRSCGPCEAAGSHICAALSFAPAGCCHRPALWPPCSSHASCTSAQSHTLNSSLAPMMKRFITRCSCQRQGASADKLRVKAATSLPLDGLARPNPTWARCSEYRPPATRTQDKEFADIIVHFCKQRCMLCNRGLVHFPAQDRSIPRLQCENKV